MLRICSGVHTGVRADALIDAWIEEALDIGVFYMGINILRFLLLFFLSFILEMEKKHNKCKHGQCSNNLAVSRHIISSSSLDSGVPGFVGLWACGPVAACKWLPAMGNRRRPTQASSCQADFN